MPIHVSIHDVAPRWRSEIERALWLCHARGIRPGLLVVPNFHGDDLLTDDAPFCDWLRGLEASGHEIFLHGYYHRSELHPEPIAHEADGHARPSGASRWFAQRVVSGSEAEFSDVDEAEARHRLAEGKRMLESIGLRMRGFVPPAWSMPKWMLGVLGEHGFAYTEDHLTIYDPTRGKKQASVVVNFASRSLWRMVSTVAYCRAIRPAARITPMRVAIHPADMRFVWLARETKSLLDWAARDPAPTVGALFRDGR